MTFLLKKNNARGYLLTSISAGSTSFTLQSGQGGLFPSGGTFRVTAVEKTLGVVTHIEIISCSARSGDVFTVASRAVEACPRTETAVTQEATAYPFTAYVDADNGTVIYCEPTAGVFDEIGTAVDTASTNIANIISTMPSKANIQNDAYNFIADSGSANTYVATLVPAVASYAAGLRVSFTASAANSGASTLNVNGLGAKSIKKYHDQDLENGDIEVGQLVECQYDGTNFQMLSQLGQIPAASVSKLSDSSFYPGEDMSSAAGKAVFMEYPTTFALATTIDVVGYSASNTRWASAIFGNGTAFTTLNLSLRKYSSPSAALSVRIETDNAGSPSGTAVTNGTATVAAGSVTLTDTVVTLAGSVTLTAGTRYWLVVNIVGDVVNSTNYYGIGTSTTHSTARVKKSYNGSAWVGNLPASDAPGVTYSSDSNTTPRGWKITANQNCNVYGVTPLTGYSVYTTCYIKDSGGSILATSTDLVNGVFQFNGYALTNGTTYRIELIPTSTYGYFTFVSTISGTYVNFVGGSSGGADHSNGASIQSIQFNSGAVYAVAMPYIAANGILTRLLSLTSASYTYKSDVHGILSSNTSIGTVAPIDLAVKGAISNTQSGQTDQATMFLSNTPGALSSTPGTNRTKVGYCIDATRLRFDKQLLFGVSLTVPASTVAYQNTSGLDMEVAVDGGTVTVIATSKDGTTYRTKYTATGNTVLLAPNDYIKLTYSSAPTMIGYYV